MTLRNNNGHGVLHKAAQRGQGDVCLWFLDECDHVGESEVGKIDQFGPDAEGYCPSDLAGMEGHESLARKLAVAEMSAVDKALSRGNAVIPEWLEDCSPVRVSSNEIYIWEKHGGVRRMKSRMPLF